MTEDEHTYIHTYEYTYIHIGQTLYHSTTQLCKGITITKKAFNAFQANHLSAQGDI